MAIIIDGLQDITSLSMRPEATQYTVLATLPYAQLCFLYIVPCKQCTSFVFRTKTAIPDADEQTQKN